MRSAKRSVSRRLRDIVAGDPGNNRINLIYGFLWSWLATHDTDGTPILPSAKLPALAKAAVAVCDKNDALRTASSAIRVRAASIRPCSRVGAAPDSIPASHATNGHVDRVR